MLKNISSRARSARARIRIRPHLDILEARVLLSTSPAVTSLVLINADTSQPIAAFAPMTSGAVLDLAALPTRHLSFQALTSPATVGSVNFGYDAASSFRVENSAPYAFNGDHNGAYYAWTPTIGNHAVSATAYTGANDSGTVGPKLSINFSVIDSGTVPSTPTVSAVAGTANTAEGSATPGVVTLSRTGATTGALTVNIALGGTATNGVDYTQVFSPITIPAGSASTTVSIRPIDDSVYEGAETAMLTIQSGSGYSINASAGSATVTIADNDAPPVSGSASYLNPAPSLPGTILLDNFDNGGEGIAYHDADPTNVSGSYRNGGVDIEPTTDATPPDVSSTDAGAGFNIGHVRAGEWMNYTVNVPSAASYSIGLRFASDVGGGTAHLEVDGVNATGSITLPYTGGWQTWQTISTPPIALSAGLHTLRLVIDTSAWGGDVGNLYWMRFSASAQAPTWPTSWQTAASAPQARFEPIGHIFNGKIYAFGGFKDSNWDVSRTYTMYDPATNKWTDLGTLPATMAETHVGVTDDGQYLYFAGGFAGNLNQSVSPSQIASALVWRWNPSTNVWSQLPSLPFARGAGQLVLVGRTLHYMGGNPADRVTNIGDQLTLNLDNPSAGWTAVAPMPNPKDHFSAVVMNGKIYVMGGEHGHDQLHQQQADMQVYDPATNTWTALASLPLAKSHMEGGTFVMNGQIIFAGGQIDNFNSTNRVFAYDPGADAWTELAPLPAYRQGGIVAPIGGKIYVTLGAVSTNGPQSSTWVGILPATTQVRALTANAVGAAGESGANTGGVIGRQVFAVSADGAVRAQNLKTGAIHVVSPAGARPFAADGATVALCGKKLYLFGGTGAAGKVQVFNPGTNRWRVLADMPYAAETGAAAIALGHRIYVAGGIVNGAVTARAAVYNPRTNRWSSLPDAPLARTDLSPSIDNARLYFSSGIAGDANGAPTGGPDDAVEIYDPSTNTWTAEGAQGWPAHPGE